jgi:hypothetical protein
LEQLQLELLAHLLHRQFQQKFLLSQAAAVVELASAVAVEQAVIVH